MEIGNGTPPQQAPAPVQAASSSKIHNADALKVEHQLIKVPFEYLKKCVRGSTRLVEKEMSAIVTSISDAAGKDLSKEETVVYLDTLVSRLQGLKRKLEECGCVEQAQLQRCRARLDHLDLLGAGGSDRARWNKDKVNRVLIDYMLRSSYYETAAKLTEASNLQNLVDIDIFMDAKRVIDALGLGDCSEALAWCSENRTKLKKMKSKLEFKLRVQEFIELVRLDKMMDAIAYARKHLAPWGQTNMKELQQAMATLAFRSNTDCPAYKALFEAKQWESLVEMFKGDHYLLYGMTQHSLLSIHLQSGLSALKTPMCYEEKCTKEDPLAHEPFQKLAENLPFSKHFHSKLVCPITKGLMNDENPPLALPNGYVYSRKALEDMAKKNDGNVICVRTQTVFHISQATKVFIS